MGSVAGFGSVASLYTLIGGATLRYATYAICRNNCYANATLRYGATLRALSLRTADKHLGGEMSPRAWKLLAWELLAALILVGLIVFVLWRW